MYQIEKAFQFALKAHSGQLDRYGKLYIFHPLRVMLKMETDDEKIVALLHDVIEDTNYTYKNMRDNGYHAEIIDAVACISRKNDEDYFEYIKRVMNNPIAVKVKLADLEDNMDIRRIEVVTGKDIERLNKYLKAYRMIMGI